MALRSHYIGRVCFFPPTLTAFLGLAVRKLLAAVVPALLFCVSIHSVSQSAQVVAVPNRVTAAIDESARIALPGNVHPLAQAQFDRGAAPASTADGADRLVLQPSPAQQQALTEYLARFTIHVAELSQMAFAGPIRRRIRADRLRSGASSRLAAIARIRHRTRSTARNVLNFPALRPGPERVPHLDPFLSDSRRKALRKRQPTRKFPRRWPRWLPAWGRSTIFGQAAGRVPGGRALDTAPAAFEPRLRSSATDLPYLWSVPPMRPPFTTRPTVNLTLTTAAKPMTARGQHGYRGRLQRHHQDIEITAWLFSAKTATTARICPTVVVDGSDPGINGEDSGSADRHGVAGGIAPKANIYLYTSDGGLGSSMVRALDDNIVSILNISFSGCEEAQGNNGNTFLLAWRRAGCRAGNQRDRLHRRQRTGQLRLRRCCGSIRVRGQRHCLHSLDHCGGRHGLLHPSRGLFPIRQLQLLGFRSLLPYRSKYIPESPGTIPQQPTPPSLPTGL